MEFRNSVGIEAWSGDFPAFRLGPDDPDNLAPFGLKAALFDGAVDSSSCDSKFLGCLCDSSIRF
jgi:hypothetical protein